MPLRKGVSKATTEANFHEFRHGKTFSRTARKSSTRRARKQMIAAVLANKRRSKRSHKR